MNQFKGPMFLQGHSSQAAVSETARAQYGARTAANDFAPALGNRAAAASWLSRAGRTPSTAPASSATPLHDVALTGSAPQGQTPRRATSLLSQLWYLGGRPMHAGQNFDLDDPFDVLASNAAEPRRSVAHSDRRRGERRLSSRSPQPQTCNA